MIFFLTLVLSITHLGTTSTDNVPKVNACLSDELCDRPFTVGTNCFMEEEIWKDIRGYVGYYQVSNRGRVKSVHRVIIRKNKGPQTIHEKILSPGKLYGKKDGYYLVVMLCKIGVDKTFQVHRLVAEAFIPKIKGKPEVNHINEIKHDNRVENLEWNNHRENNTYKKKNKTSRFTGVHWDSANRNWAVNIHYNKKQYRLGNFDSEIKASKAYKSEIKRLGLVNKYIL